MSSVVGYGPPSTPVSCTDSRYWVIVCSFRRGWHRTGPHPYNEGRRAGSTGAGRFLRRTPMRGRVDRWPMGHMTHRPRDDGLQRSRRGHDDGPSRPSLRVPTRPRLRPRPPLVPRPAGCGHGHHLPARRRRRAPGRVVHARRPPHARGVRRGALLRPPGPRATRDRPRRHAPRPPRRGDLGQPRARRRLRRGRALPLLRPDHRGAARRAGLVRARRRGGARQDARPRRGGHPRPRLRPAPPGRADRRRHRPHRCPGGRAGPGVAGAPRRPAVLGLPRPRLLAGVRRGARPEPGPGAGRASPSSTSAPGGGSAPCAAPSAASCWPSRWPSRSRGSSSRWRSPTWR